MKCQQTRRDLSGYVDGGLDDARTAAVRDHLASCEDCRREHETLRKALSLLGSLEPGPAPPGFAVRVNEEIDRRLRARTWRRRLFFPLHVKLPLEALAAAAVLAALLLHPQFGPLRRHEELRPDEHREESIKSSEAPGAIREDTYADELYAEDAGLEKFYKSAPAKSYKGRPHSAARAREMDSSSTEAEPMNAKNGPPLRAPSLELSERAELKEEPARADVPAGRGKAGYAMRKSRDRARSLRGGERDVRRTKSAPADTRLHQWSLDEGRSVHAPVSYQQISLVMVSNEDNRRMLAGFNGKWNAQPVPQSRPVERLLRETARDRKREAKQDGQSLSNTFRFNVSGDSYPLFLRALARIGMLYSGPLFTGSANELTGWERLAELLHAQEAAAGRQEEARQTAGTLQSEVQLRHSQQAHPVSPVAPAYRNNLELVVIETE